MHVRAIMISSAGLVIVTRQETVRIGGIIVVVVMMIVMRVVRITVVV